MAIESISVAPSTQYLTSDAPLEAKNQSDQQKSTGVDSTDNQHSANELAAENESPQKEATQTANDSIECIEISQKDDKSQPEVPKEPSKVVPTLTAEADLNTLDFIPLTVEDTGASAESGPEGDQNETCVPVASNQDIDLAVNEAMPNEHPSQTIADVDDNSLSGSDLSKEIDYPNVPQDLGQLELTSQFDQEDLTEKCDPPSLTNGDTVDDISEQESKQECIDSFVAHSKLGKLLKDIRTPSSQGGWSSKGIPQSTIPCSSLNLLMDSRNTNAPRMFVCGGVMEQPLQPLTTIVEEAASEVDQQAEESVTNEPKMEIELEQSDDLGKDAPSGPEGEDSVRNESDMDKSHTSPQLTMSHRISSNDLPQPSTPAIGLTKQRAEIFIPNLPYDMAPTAGRISKKFTQLRKHFKSHSQSDFADISPVVVDLRPQRQSKGKPIAQEEECSQTKKRKHVRTLTTGESSSFGAVEINLTSSGARKKGTATY